MAVMFAVGAITWTAVTTLAAGCASGDGEPTTQADSAEIPQDTRQQADTTDAAAGDTPGSEDGPFGGDDPQDERMPDVLCMDLQSAQDEIQDHGVLLSGSTEMTGQGRNQMVDSNWVVVYQFPDPGVPISEGDAELGVVKFGEESSAGSDC